MPDGRAAFTAIELPRTRIPDGMFMLTSRRGKQFNSITWGERDPITGARSRRDVLFAAADLEALGIREGDPVLLRSGRGELSGIARSGPCRRRHVQAFWPESNVLVGRAYDPVSGEPDYSAVVSVERAS
jgi:anaerobic selenocysteine-containing dehydrogenase